jgi:LmbE family N-acetylglucosaminyl deacetylase
LYVDITEYFDTKVKAIEEHKSQIDKITYGNSWLHGIEVRAEYRGYEAGVKYAEAFEVVRLLE